MLNQVKALMHSDSSIMAMKVVDIHQTVDLYDKIKSSYLKKCHVGAIIAIVLVIVCIVDKRTVFLWNTITCGDTSKTICEVMKVRQNYLGKTNTTLGL